MTKLLVQIFLLISLTFSLSALAQSEPTDPFEHPVLTVRQLPSAHYEAVVTYGSNYACSLSVNPPSSVEMDGANILVESPYFAPRPCIGTPPPPFFLIEQTADLGELSTGEYSVNWVQTGNFSLTTTIEVSGLPPEPRANTNPYPETGLWYNPDESGTGFDLEFQGGIMAGHYFGYDTSGKPEWYLVTNTLTASTTPGVMWELVIEPQRYTGGNCLGCAYQPPNSPELLAPIKIEFLERAQAKLTLGDGSVQYMVPIIYGDVTTPIVSEHVTQNLPVFAAGSSQWVIVFNDYDEATQSSSMWDSYVLQIDAPEVADSDPNTGRMWYPVYKKYAPDKAPSFVGDITCQQNVDPVCYLQIHGRTAFLIPIGNFTDSRFFGNAANGDTVQGFRLNYD